MKTTISILFSIFCYLQTFAILNVPSLVSPANGSTNNAPNEILDWGTSTGATAYQYKLGTIASLTGVNAQTITGSSQVTTSNLLFGTVYYWQVRAIKTTAPTDSSDWSTIISFTTIDFVSLIAPTNGAINQAPNELLDWSALSGITFYDYQWDTSATLNSPLSFYNSIATGTSQVASSNLRFGTKYYWRVRARHSADTSQWSSVFNFTTIDFVSLIAPTNGAINQAPNELLDWSALSGISFYDYQWDSSLTFTSPLSFYNSIATGTSQVASSNLRFGTKYFWRVRARHAADTSQWSSVFNFTTIDFVLHLTPTNNSIGITINPIIDWSPVTGILGYQYRYSTDLNFTNPSLTTIGTSSSQATLSNLSYGTEHFWQVRAFHAADTSEWSLPWSFTTVYQLTTAPVLLSPADASNSVLAFGALLEWEAVPSATLYQFQVDDNSQFSSPLSNSTTELSEFTGQLLGETTYYWRVQAGNGSGFSPWSTVWTFTTDIVTGVINNDVGNGFSIYPNPSNGNFNCAIRTTNLIVNYFVEIYNLNGQLIQQLLTTNPSFSIDLNAQPNGIYFVKIKSEKEVFTKRIVKY